MGKIWNNAEASKIIIQLTIRRMIDFICFYHSLKISELERELKVHRDPEVTTRGSRPQIAERRQAPRGKRVKLAHAHNNLSTEMHPNFRTPDTRADPVLSCYVQPRQMTWRSLTANCMHDPPGEDRPWKGSNSALLRTSNVVMYCLLTAFQMHHCF